MCMCIQQWSKCSSTFVRRYHYIKNPKTSQYNVFNVIFLIFTSFSKNMHGASTGAMFLSVCHASLKVVKTYF